MIHGGICVESKEYFEVLDSFGNKTGKLKLRSEVHRDGDWHRAVHIWLMDEKGNLLIQQRSAMKDINPGKWTCSCAGHVDPNEDSRQAVIRELNEELGLESAIEQLEYIGTMKRYHSAHNDFNDQEIIDLFLLMVDFEKNFIKKQDEEVSKLSFYDYNKLKEDMFRDDSPLAVSQIECMMLLRVIEKINDGDISIKCQAMN